MAVRRIQRRRERGGGGGGGGGEGEGEEDEVLKLKLYTDPWVVKKKLMDSDINNHLSRVILPSDQVEKYVLPFLNSKERHDVLESGRGLWVRVKDWDTDTHHLLSFLMWKSNGSYKLGHRWIPEFVNRRNLRKGDVIGMFWDDSTRSFCFRVLERSLSATEAAAPPPPPPPDPSLCEFALENLHLSQPINDP